MEKLLPESEEFAEASRLQTTPWMYGMVLLIFGIIIGGLIFIARFNDADYQRDVQNWKEKLNLIAENRKTDVSHFISGNFSELRTLADNPSLKLYLTELDMIPQIPDAPADSEPSQKSYLRNLLVFTAQRAGFMGKSVTDVIPANIPSENKSGLLVMGKDDQLIVGTPMVNTALARLTDLAKTQKAGEEGLIDMHKDTDGTLYIGFSVPIYSIQGEHNAESQIGKIVAIKTIDDNLFNLLKQPGSTEKTLENVLVRVNKDGQTEYLSPLQDGEKPILKNEKHTVMESLSGKDNMFLADERDYRGAPVLAMSRSIEGTDWKLISKIDISEAFAESGAHRLSLKMVFTLVIAVIVLILITMWWYASSRHSLMASSYFKKVAIKSRAQEHLLRLVTDYQPEAIYIVDENQNYRFANKNVAEAASMSAESVAGKTVSDVRGSVRAGQVKEQCDNALASWQPVYAVHHEYGGKDEIIIRSGYIPIKEIPVASLPEKTKGVLVVEQDVSEVYHERERRLSIQKQLVQTLLNLVDKRDPFAANHSFLVSQIAYHIASDMKLDSAVIEATKTAANLMNIGKILVPSELLTKTGQLTEDEKNTIHNSMDAASELLDKVEFDGPVSETLKQWQEKWDGTGALKLKGDDILVSARIIAVSNAFIGMISPRSWRSAMTIEAANKFLLDQSGSYFDPRVVVALIHYVENESGREWINSIIKNNKHVA